MSVIVRFAPSPTGDLHIGGARTALFNYLFAKNQGGKFLLRIEDTDQERSTDSAIKAILDGLNWLGLKPDDNHVLQSQNAKRHQEIANKLLENDQAYLCYVQAQELEEMRQKAAAKNEVFRFQSPWRNKAMSQHSNLKPVVRIKAPLQGDSTINDLVQGRVVVKNSELDDFVILRSNNSATYMLAVVVDDFDMNITHIIRGDDHLNNAFRQKIIYDAMKWQLPEFGHIPLIHGSDGAKMSKRHGAVSVMQYHKMGYLPQAMRNYLLRLGWSHGDDEIITDNQAIEWFNLNKIGKSAARFDFDKLNFINKYYIKETDDKLLFNMIADNLGSDISNNSVTRITKAISFLKERCTVIDDLLKAVEIYLDDYKVVFSDQDKETIISRRNIILKLQELFNNLENWDSESIKSSLKQFGNDNNLKMKDFGPLLRIILTFSSSSGGAIFEIISLLGSQEVAKRISNAINV